MYFRYEIHTSSVFCCVGLYFGLQFAFNLDNVVCMVLGLCCYCVTIILINQSGGVYSLTTF